MEIYNKFSKYLCCVPRKMGFHQSINRKILRPTGSQQKAPLRAVAIKCLKAWRRAQSISATQLPHKDNLDAAALFLRQIVKQLKRILEPFRAEKPVRENYCPAINQKRPSIIF